jgi:hypothetical protein
MSDAPIFCKFAHNATLHAEGETLRIYFGADQGYSCSFGTHDYRATFREPIIAAVSIDELVCHIMTDRDVYEVNGRNGLIIQRIGPTLSRHRRAAA